MRHRRVLPSAAWCQRPGAGHPATPVLSRALPCRCD